MKHDGNSGKKAVKQAGKCLRIQIKAVRKGGGPGRATFDCRSILFCKQRGCFKRSMQKFSVMYVQGGCAALTNQCDGPGWPDRTVFFALNLNKT